MRNLEKKSPLAMQQQKGAVLVIALIMLLMLTIIGTSSMSTTALEEKMVGNMFEYNLAFQAAEVALREGEDFLENTALITADSSDGIHDRGNAPSPLDDSLWDTGAQWRTSNNVAGLSEDHGEAGYHIERIGNIEPPTGKNVGFNQGYKPKTGGGVTGYRVVAWGTGRNETVKVVLSSYYGKKEFQNAN